MLNFLGRTPVLIVLLFAMLAIGYSFRFVQADIGDGVLLDMVWSGEEARQRLAEMSAVERSAHLWGTLINDTLYPFAYGGLFIGLTARFSTVAREALIVPALCTIVVDLAENSLQALALSGRADLLFMKSALTPLKFGLFLIAVVIVVFVLIGALMRRLSKRG